MTEQDFAGIYTEYQRLVRSICGRVLVRFPACADDAVQETMMTLWRCGDSIRGDRKAWISTVAQNAAARIRQRECRDVDVLPLHAVDIPERDTFAVAAFADSAVRARLLTAIQALAPRQRDVITAFYFHGQSVAAIAAERGLVAATVTSCLVDARANLRKHLLRSEGF